MRRSWRLGRMLALALAALCSAICGAEAKDAFRLGVRADARPFVYADGDTYAGFLYDMCRAAIAFAQVDPTSVELVPVTAADRFATATEGRVSVAARRASGGATVEVGIARRAEPVGKNGSAQITNREISQIA